MPIPDPATITIASATVLTWLLGISFVLGQYSQRQKGSEKEADKLAATIKEIFAKLDMLSAVMPHKCIQIQSLADLSAASRVTDGILRDHTGRMDRIEQTIRDKEQAHIREE